MLSLCFEAGDLAELDTVLLALSKKRGLLKDAMANTIQQCIAWVGSLPDREARHKLIKTVRTVTEGKIYLEVERAQVTRILANILEYEEGDIPRAAQIMQELQGETFMSLVKRTKIDFILEQVRLSIAVDEFSKATLMARKLSSKTFENPSFEDLKLRYLELLIILAVREHRYLDCYRHYRDIYLSPTVNADADRSLTALKMTVIFAIMAPHTPEQHDILNLLMKEKRMSDLTLYAELLRTFLTAELVRWPVVEKVFGDELRAFPHLFGDNSECQARWRHLADRVLEHNVRVISTYYSQISIGRFAALLERNAVEAERTLCSLIERDMVYGKIDRISGIINFEPAVQPDAVLNGWSQRVDSLLSLMVKTNHQISKEEMLFHSQ